MKTAWMWIAYVVLLCTLSSCLEKDVYQGPKEEDTAYNDFDFSTVASDVNLEVSYENIGVKTAVYFEVYDESPVVETETGYAKRADVEPLYAAYTGKDGVFRGKVDLPAYMDKAYIYSPAFYAQTLIEADVTDGKVTARDKRPGGGEGRRTGGKGVCYMIGGNDPKPSDAYKDKWHKALGDYSREGYVSYEYAGGDLSIGNYAELYTAHTSVISREKECPEHLRGYSDMYVNEDAEVAVTFLGQNTCWNCSMGYYYYREGEQPASLQEANVILLFPNTQDGKWDLDAGPNYTAFKTRGVERGTTVQLKYYPHIAEGGDMSEATTVFPAGYRIGFVLANNAWSERVQGFEGNNKNRSATSEGLSVDNNGIPYGTPRTAVYGYGDVVMISFEDYTTDQNFSDVVITMKTNPVDAITDIPVVDPETQVTKTNVLKGVFAFEDLWPDAGDYDMNDVLVLYHYGKTLDIYKEILAETFTFKTAQNYAGNDNGLAFTLKGGNTPASVKYEIKRPGSEEFVETTAFTYEAETNSYLLTENVKTDMGAEYRVTLNYDRAVTTESEAQVYLYKNENLSGTGRWEVHIAQEAPTPLMDKGYFGTQDDQSRPDEGTYYVRGGKYPFAFFLAGAKLEDLDRLLIRDNERVRIDQLYPAYTGWVESNGQTNKDWYKQ